MALENKFQRIKREALETLPRIAQSMNEEPGYTFTSPEVLGWLVKNELAEGNETIVNEHGAIATRLTQKGVDKVMSESANVEAAAPVKQTYAILNVEIPASAKRKTGGGRHGSKYPFEALEVGASFFVPVSAEVPEPLKTMAASIANANARFAVPVINEDGTAKLRDLKNRKTGEVKQVPVMAFTKTFAATAYELEGVKGALVFRRA